MKTYKAYEPPKKQCNKCHQWKSLEMFYNQRDSPDGKASACKTCTYSRSPWDKSPRVCSGCQSEFIPVQPNQIYCCPQCRQQTGRFFILERDEFRCIYCGMSSVEDTAQLHIDHIVPRFHGGENVAGNLVTACARCNLEKSHWLLGEKNMTRLLAEVKKRNFERGIEPHLIIKQ